ncbi:MAG: DUF2281 domain-containing protein [Deltaproteobacteria bacterium]|nr:DUF2281 domain-containing protein [Deltaproteobacteria bacterium]
MQDKQTVIREINDLPETLLQEVLDFVRFLKARTARRPSETALSSETVLRKDWLKPEEDEAWRDL